MVIEFKSKNIAKFEKETGKNIYSIVGYSTTLAVDFLKVATGVFDDEDTIYDLLDSLIKEKGSLRAVVDYLIDLCEQSGFFTYLTAANVKEILTKQEETLKTESMLSEDEKQKKMEEMIVNGLKKLQTSGTKNGKK